MKKRMLSLLALGMLSSFAHAASLDSLDKEQVTSLFQDRTVTTISMVTLEGHLVNNTFTGYWGKDGKVVGQLAKKPSNGPEGDKGVWEVKKDGSLCVTWEHWAQAQQRCLDVYQTKNMVMFVNKDHKFETAALKEDFREGDLMN